MFVLSSLASLTHKITITPSLLTNTKTVKMKSAGGDGTILTETLFCTHLGVSVPNHTMTVRLIIVQIMPACARSYLCISYVHFSKYSYLTLLHFYLTQMIGEGKDDPPETYNSWGFVMGK